MARPTIAMRLPISKIIRFGGYCLVTAALAPAAPAAPDMAAALRALQAQDARVTAIAWRLVTANVALCRDAAPQPGILLYDAALYAPEARAAARGLFALDGPVTIGAVAPGSAAAHAGLRAGDSIRAVDDAPLPVRTPGPAGTSAGVDEAYAMLDQAAARGAVTLALRRAGRPLRATFTVDRGCASFVQLVAKRRLNAGADGRTVSISTALADETADDDELAIVIAHELAHNIRRHRLRLDEAKVTRGPFAGLGRNGTSLRAAEAEADRVGLYLAARAGYDPGAAARFWMRFGRATDPIVSDGTHPGWRRRVAALTATAAEIAARRADGRPLVPDPPPR